VRYFKNTELAKLYHVSEKSVRNWIRAAAEGKLELQLHTENDKSYVANTSANSHALDQLVLKGKKYKNTRSFRVVSPTKEFYELYKRTQVLDIISHLAIHHEIPTLYSYVDGGAKFWDHYAMRLSEEQSPSLLKSTVELLDATAPTIDRFLDDHPKVNVVDLGPGNGLPVRSTLERLLKQGRLKRYIAIDGSQAMLDIVEDNIKTWFHGKVHYEGYIRDFSTERFDDLLADEYVGESSDVPANLILLLGGTLNNLRMPNQALQTINSSLGADDLLLYGGYLDTPSTRRYFDFNVASNQKIRSELILNFLGIDDSLYDLEQKFDSNRLTRLIGFRPKVDLTIKFELPNGFRYVELLKNEPIVLWRSWHLDRAAIFKLLDQNSFNIVQGTTSRDQEHVLITSKIKTLNNF
jgi:uncharacterized SAM-dependent methyltransferase